MSHFPLHNLTIRAFQKGIREKEFSAEEVTREYLDAIDSKNGDLNAYLGVFHDSALESAKRVDVMVADGGELPALAGAPLALKDNILVEGTRTTAGSKILENYTASYDAKVTELLKDQNAVFLGKTNLDEFAMGSSTENSAFGPTKNPHDPSRVPGGSSGGSAAVVAGGLALAALGSDTGGSIRQPAAFCGVVGLKPTYGAVSRRGLIAMASSLDQIGPITKTVEDAAIMFDAIRGEDSYDSTSADAEKVHPLDFKENEIGNLKIGIPKEFFTPDLDKRVAKEMENVMDKLKDLGFQFASISLPHVHYALSVYYIIMPAEVSANLARFDGMRYARTNDQKLKTDNLKNIYFGQRGLGFGDEAKRRILLGTFVLSAGYYDAYYAKAQKVRSLIARDFEEAWKSVDVILSPTTPTPAFKLGEKLEDPLEMYLSDIFTIPANLTGLPAISIPAVSHSNPSRIRTNENRIFDPHSGSFDVSSSGLPVGFQLIGKRFHERDILGIGQYYEGL